MQFPNKKLPLGGNDYLVERDPAARKKMYIIIGIVSAVVIILLLLLTRGKSPAGQLEMQSSLQASSEALAILNKYDDKLKFSTTKNDVSLSKALLQGNFQELNTLYNKTYKPKQRLSTSPKLDKASQATLDAADRDNSLDSAILTVLKPKITKAEENLRLAKPNFTKKDSLDKINSALTDLNSIQDAINRDR